MVRHPHAATRSQRQVLHHRRRRLWPGGGGRGELHKLTAASVLHAAEAGPEHMVRMTWYITHRDTYISRLKEVGSVYRDIMGKHFPAMTCVVVQALVEERALVEIEVTAVVPD